MTDVYYAGSEEEWAKIDGSDELSGENITIHYNSARPGDAGDENVFLDSVLFLSKWDAKAKQAFFDNGGLAYSVTDETDLTGAEPLESLVGRYVLVETDKEEIFKIARIAPVESAVGEASAAGEHSLTIGGKGLYLTLPWRESPFCIIHMTEPL